MADFYELNILHMDQKSTEEKIIQAYKLGYSVITVNVFIEADETETEGKKKKKAKEIIPEISKSDLNKIIPQEERNNFQVLTRITLKMTDIDRLHRLLVEASTKYDIVAIVPTTEKTFQHACMNLNVDIISLDVENKPTFKCKFSPVGMALKRGIYFEICYSPSIRDSTARKYTINSAHNLMLACKGRNLILSSGAEKAIEIRGPYDVANLGLLFGMNEAQSKDAISVNGRAVVLLAGKKHMAKETVKVKKVVEYEELEEDEDHSEPAKRIKMDL